MSEGGREGESVEEREWGRERERVGEGGREREGERKRERERELLRFSSFLYAACRAMQGPYAVDGVA